MRIAYMLAADATELAIEAIKSGAAKLARLQDLEDTHNQGMTASSVPSLGLSRI